MSPRWVSRAINNIADMILIVIPAVSLDQDVDTNKELIGHGISNLLAGFTGSVSDVFIFVAQPAD